MGGPGSGRRKGGAKKSGSGSKFVQRVGKNLGLSNASSLTHPAHAARSIKQKQNIMNNMNFNSNKISYQKFKDNKIAIKKGKKVY
jgi:hypothetical protein